MAILVMSGGGGPSYDARRQVVCCDGGALWHREPIAAVTEPPPARTCLPMQLRVGDRFIDENGEWEVIGEPSTLWVGHVVRVWVQRPGDPTSTKNGIWPADVKLTVRPAR